LVAGLQFAAIAAGLGGLACGPTTPQAARPPQTAVPPPADDPDLAARAEDAAMYALPLVIMDLTHEQFFADPVMADATPNRFVHIPILANPTFRSVVRPNVDTLYSTAWVDVGAEPVLLTVPASAGRYYLIQCMDAWTNVFSAPGIRTLGDRAASYALVGPDWHGQLPAGTEPGTEIVRAPTRMVWVLGRVYVRDPADLSAARTFQRQLDLRPASRAGDAGYRAALPHPRDPSATRRIMRDLLRDLGPAAFFERFSRLTADNPPAADDAPFIASVLTPLGLAPSAPLSWASLDDTRRAALTGGLERMLHAFENRSQLQPLNPTTPTGWSSMAAKLAQGSYGTHYKVRAAVAAVGLGANLRADAIYMNASLDSNHQPLDGGKPYRLTFAAGQEPPVRAFWSVTLYDEAGYLVTSPVERYAVKSGDPLVRGADGSLTIYLQPDDPGPDHRANWLPTPAHQRFELSLRAYWPDQALLDDRWMPPAVRPAP
jgi:hypothetical protein